MIYETPLTETPESWQEENIPSVTPLSFIDDVNETENLEDQEKIEPQQAEIEKVETEVIETVIVNIESTAEITDSEKQQEILEIVEAAAEIGTIESVEITTTDTIVISLETPEEKESQD
jgi:hypothetical protein